MRINLKCKKKIGRYGCLALEADEKDAARVLVIVGSAVVTGSQIMPMAAAMALYSGINSVSALRQQFGL